MKKTIADLLDGLALFRDFSYPDLMVVANYLTMEASPRGATVFQEGDPGNFMLILVDGRISIFKAGENGRRLLCVESKGRCIGEMALLDKERRSATCIAESDCEYLTLTQGGLERLAQDHPGLAYRFMFCLAQLLSRRLRRASGIMADLLGDAPA